MYTDRIDNFQYVYGDILYNCFMLLPNIISLLFFSINDDI